MRFRTYSRTMMPIPGSDLEFQFPPCRRCHKPVTSHTLAMPGIFARIGVWLIGHGWMPKGFIILNPCDHLITAPAAVEQAFATSQVLEALTKYGPTLGTESDKIRP